MSWRTAKDKERFFDELDRAFNTPASETLVLPQAEKGDAIAEVSPGTSGIKRKSRDEDENQKKRRRASAPVSSQTGVARSTGIERPTPRRSTTSKKSLTPQQSSENLNDLVKKSDLLNGMILFFIPNSKKNGVRRFRMKLFAEHGAEVRDEWSEEITHIICDNNITGDRILNTLRWEQIPTGVIVVNELWIPECLEAKRILDRTRDRYQVPGVQSQTTNESYSLEGQRGPYLDGSLQIKPVVSKHRPEPETYEEEDRGDVDVQDLVFGRPPSPPDPSVAEREALDQDSLSQSSPVLPRDALDDAINEIREFGVASSFIDDAQSNSDSEGEEEMTRPDVPNWQKGFQCMYAHDGTEGQNNPNSKTIEILSKMQAYYDRTNDQWRAISYRKAISALKKVKEYVSTEGEARKIPGVGERLAKKIAEIATTGELQRLQNLDPLDHTVELFMGIYGVGKTRAMRWVMQGLRTLKDVLERGDVNESQRIGIELYEDFSQRIPRAEVEQHAQIVKDAALKVDKTLQVYTMGSYRRGAQTCGDIDMIITRPNAASADLMRLMVPLVDSLFDQKFLTHSLATSHSDDGSKWHGVSQLPGGLHRRLDLLFVPWQERGAALIYFTGNDIFNRSLRLLASKKGMGLNQRGLFKDTLRGPGRVKITRGTCIASESEEEIFRILGVPWRPPELRNC